MAIKAIIFDIDGVLADSRDAVVHNTKELMREFGFAVEGADVERMSSAHSAESVLVALAPSLSQDPELLGKMLRRLSEITNGNLHLIRPTHLTAAVPYLAKKYGLAAASNRKASAAMVLGKLGIARYFSAVLTSADAPPKPDPKMIKMALERLGVASQEALFVGDNKEDELAGRGAGVGFVMLDGRSSGACKAFLAGL